MDSNSSENQYLNNYLECEKVLGEFFKKSNYCQSNCIKNFISRYPTMQPGNVGCCHNSFYKSTTPETILLNQQREKIYGHLKQDNPVINENKKTCDYHSESGCETKTHKSPKCVSFICSAYENHLFKEHNIVYDHEEINEMLTDVLSGKLKKPEVEFFKNKIRQFLLVLNK